MPSSEMDLCLTSLTVEDFLRSLASGRPTPGGGSAAALAGATAAALIVMVTQLTIGREQYAVSERQMIHIYERAETLRERLMALVNEDAQAYQDLLNQYALPKVTDSDNALRASEIQRALRRASDVPMETAELCRELTELAATASMLGNRNAASDAAVAAMLAHAGLRCAAASAHTNLRILRDEAIRSGAKARLGQLLADGNAALSEALTAVGLGD